MSAASRREEPRHLPATPRSICTSRPMTTRTPRKAIGTASRTSPRRTRSRSTGSTSSAAAPTGRSKLTTGNRSGRRRTGVARAEGGDQGRCRRHAAAKQLRHRGDVQGTMALPYGHRRGAEGHRDRRESACSCRGRPRCPRGCARRPKHAGQTTGEGLNNFGAGWYALTANGKKVEPAAPAPSTGGGYSHGGADRSRRDDDTRNIRL